jgi:periplasmic protein TonB
VNASVPIEAGPDAELAPAKDRLTTTLFLAALFHGIVILGVTFAAPPVRDNSIAPTLEVLLLTGQDQSGPDNKEAQYLAQRSQKGSGTTRERVRPGNPPSSIVQAQQAGIANGNGTEFHKSAAGEAAQDLLTARSDENDVSYSSGDPQPAMQAEAPIALTITFLSPIATSATDDALRLRGKDARTLEITPDTRESRLAPYLDSWRRKVERLGTSNFPAELRAQEITNNPVLEVTIKSNGSLANILVRRSSGRPEVDQAALSILRLASPFDPFPRSLRRDYDQLRFAYEWQFLAGSDVPAPAQ